MNPRTEKAIIIYFSHSNHTKFIAEYIARKMKVGLCRIETIISYPGEHQALIDEVSSQNKAGFLPDINTIFQNISDCNTIFLGFPVWKNRLPPPVRTFLRNNKLTGKIVIPFNTHGGLGLGISIREISEFCPGAEIREAFSEKGDSIETADSLIDDWLNKVFLNQPATLHNCLIFSTSSSSNTEKN